MNPSSTHLATSTTIINSVSDCIRCMFRAMAQIVVIAEHSHDDGAPSMTHHVRAERLFLRHAYYSNIVDGRYTTSSRVESHTLFLSTTTGISSTTNHRSLLAHHLRGLNHDSANNTTNESVYVSSETEKGAFTAGTIISILLCILIVVLFIWLGYCACWFSHGGSLETDDDDNPKEETMTTEERKKYVERTIVCRRYESQPMAESTVFADSRVDAKVSDEDTGDVTTIKHKCERMQHQPPQCSICLEQFVDGDMIVESSSINMDCMHEFHRNCIHQWCMFQTNCPCCRRELLFINNISIFHENDDDNQTLPNDSFRSI